jgi:hypothetical protein
MSLLISRRIASSACGKFTVCCSKMSIQSNSTKLKSVGDFVIVHGSVTRFDCIDLYDAVEAVKSLDIILLAPFLTFW